MGQSTRTPYYIVDGQQRLLTLTILLAAIRDLRILPEAEQNYLERSFLKYESDFGLCHLLGYEVDLPSHYYLIKNIFEGTQSSEPITAYTENLKACKEYFDSELRYKNLDQIQKLVRIVTQQLQFNYYEIDRHLDVFVVFETMNHRGRPLSKLELLKNRLLYLATLIQGESERLRNEINDAWRFIYEWLAKSNDKLLDDDAFLRAHWIMFVKHDKDSGSVLRKFDFSRRLLEYFSAQRVRSGDIDATDITKYVQSLRNSVQPWYLINFPYDQAVSATPSIRLWISLINEVRKDSFFRPIVMALLQSTTSDDEKERVLKAIERHEFLVTALVGSRSTANRPHFWRQASRFYEGRLDADGLIKDVDRQAKKFFNGEKFKKNFERHCARFAGEEGGWRAWPYTNYLLRAYERDFNGEIETLSELAALDQVFPKSSERGLSWSHITSNHSRQRIDLLCSSLGNLVLGRKKNDPRPETGGQAVRRRTDSSEKHSFEYKKRRASIWMTGSELGYFSGSANEREVAESSTWGHRQIYERAIKILAFMARRWDIQISSISPTLTYINFDGISQNTETSEIT